MRSFITGSHAYGKPTADSDIDLVVMISKKDYEILRGLDDAEEGEFHEYEGCNIRTCLRFGKLNLIICKTQEEFDCWKQGTHELKARKPVSRVDAIEHFRLLREEIPL